LDVSDPEHPKAGKPESFQTNITDEFEPAFSPDGRWIAFRLDGPSRVFVRRFPGPGGKWEIGPGRHPVWARTGGELYYFNNAENHIMVAPTTPERTRSLRLNRASGRPRRSWSPITVFRILTRLPMAAL